MRMSRNGRNLLKINKSGTFYSTIKRGSNRINFESIFDPDFRQLAALSTSSRHTRRGVYLTSHPMPSWYENRVRRYEQMRFDQEPKRRTLPFAWGVEYIGGDAADPHPEDFFDRYVSDAVAQSDAWYAIEPATDYTLAENILTFSSAIASPWPENNRVHAQFFPARRRSHNGTRGPGVVVLAQWNAKWHEQQNVCLWLNKLGLTAVKMSLPYHDRRAIPDHPRADHLVGPNLGLTLQD